MTTLVITNDFPPRLGGIEAFVAQGCGFLDDVVVLTSRTPGQEADERRFDSTRPYPVVRLGPVLLPTPATLLACRRVAAEHGCDRAWFGAAAPLALLAGALRADGMGPLVATTHGHEVWWSRTPGARAALRLIGRDVDALTTISGWTARHVAAALAPADRHKLVALPPPVDLDLFSPAAPKDGGEPRRPPTVVTAGRFVPRKNHATLLRAFALVRAQVPAARLLVAGDGPQAARLRRLAGPGVELVGPFPHDQMPGLYRRGDVFASPVTVRPMDQEGFGMVFAEAAACGLPVVVGRSGGAPETVVDGTSGVVVEPHDERALARVLVDLLHDPVRAAAMGAAGREHVRQFGADIARATLRGLLGLPAGS